MNGYQPKKGALGKPPNTGTSVQKAEKREKALYSIDRIITLLDFGAQLGADVTICKEDIPILLTALEPQIKARAEYWEDLYAKCKQLIVPEKKATEPKHNITCQECKYLVNSSADGYVYCTKRDRHFERHITAVDCVYAERVKNNY